MSHRPGHMPDTDPTPVQSYQVLDAASLESLNLLVEAALAQGMVLIGTVQRGPTGRYLQAVGEPVPTVEPGGSYPMLVARGDDSTGMTEIVALSFNTTDGLGAAVGDAYDLNALGYSGYRPGISSIPVSSPGLLYMPCTNFAETPQDAAVLAFTITQGAGVARVPGAVALDIGDAQSANIPSLAIAPDGKVYAFADDSSGAFTVRAGNISEGTLAAVGNPLTEAGSRQTSGSFVANVIDGHFCVAVRDSADGFNHAELRSFAFDGTDWTAADTLNLDGAYKSWCAIAGYLVGTRDDGTVNVYGYTAAGGFALAWSLDPTTLDGEGVFNQHETTIADAGTGLLWVGLANETYELVAYYVLEAGSGQFDLVAAVESLPEPVLYPHALYGDVLFGNDLNYEGTYAYVRTGGTLSAALPGGLPDFDTLVPLPLTS